MEVQRKNSKSNPNAEPAIQSPLSIDPKSLNAMKLFVRIPASACIDGTSPVGFRLRGGVVNMVVSCW